MAQEIKRPDGIEIVIASMCVHVYVHVCVWGGEECLWMCVPSEARRRFPPFYLMPLRQDLS